MAKIVGHVDARDRPIVSLSVHGAEDGIPVLVDTGFNGQLLITYTDLARLNCEMLKIDVPVELANRERRVVSLARWCGEAQDVRVWVVTTMPARAAMPDEPIGLLGTALLNPYQLTVDFATRRVAISKPNE